MERGIIVAFVQIKGGVGKSTLVTNLSVAISNDNKKVKIIDCDVRQKTSSKWVARRIDSYPKKNKIFCSIQSEELRNSVVEDSKNYDAIIIDIQGRDSPSLRTALLISDIVYIPFIPSQNDIETMEELSELLKETFVQNKNRVTLYILNNCSSHYLDKSCSDASIYLSEYSNILAPSQAQIFHRKVYNIASSEGLGIIETKDTKAKEEILILKKEVINYV